MKMDKLVEALNKAVQGEVTLHPRVAARVLQNIRGDGGEDQQLFTDLTERELDVLKLIANGMTNSQIAEDFGDHRKHGEGPCQQYFE